MLDETVLEETLGCRGVVAVEVLCAERQLVLGRVSDPSGRLFSGAPLSIMGLDATALEELGPEGVEVGGSWWAPVAHGPWLLGLVQLAKPATRAMRRRLALLAERVVDTMPVPDGAPPLVWVQHADGRWFGAGVPTGEVCRAADHLRGGADAPTVVHARRRHVVLQVLAARDGERSVLVQSYPTQRVSCPPLVRLTPMQAAVVSYAVAGATVKETARTLERSHETVRQHLRGAYDRLGVACRAELVSACRWAA